MKPILERLYETFNRPEFLHTDPIIHIYGYDDPSDREVVGFVASSLAYGRVAQINRSVASVLRRLSSSPSRFVASASMDDLREKFSDFKHRFTTGLELAGTLFGLGAIIRTWGSLNSCFLHAVGKGDETVIPALTFLVEKIREESGMDQNSLLPSPSGGSACK
ncbi:MAG: DUF2400 family protein, partial [Syntrophales bacterium]|nr:DUF2400 family protein [Syntrophales bacterium]